jgi:GNAT superfamily N-acetyltransferase
MGLLEVLPIHRGKGYGTELESYLIARMLKRDLIPFCQIETDNDKSLNLQKKSTIKMNGLRSPVFAVRTQRQTRSL